MIEVVHPVLRGHHSGELVFTTLLWPGGPPAPWPLHLARLAADAKRSGLVPPDLTHLAQDVDRAVGGIHGLPRVRIDLVAVGGNPWVEPPHTTAIQITARPALTTELAPEPARVTVGDAGHRHSTVTQSPKQPNLSLLLARNEARRHGFDDALLSCNGDHLVEACTSAILVGIGDTDWLSLGHSCGAIASTTVQALGQRNPLRRGVLGLRELPSIRWMLLCNAVSGARAVSHIEMHKLGSPPADLMAELRHLCQTPTHATA